MSDPDLSASLATLGFTLVLCAFLLIVADRTQAAIWAMGCGTFAAILAAATSERK